MSRARPRHRQENYETDRAEAAALREADRAEVKSQFRWLVGIVASFGVSILAAVVTPMAVSLISG